MRSRRSFIKRSTAALGAVMLSQSSLGALNPVKNRSITSDSVSLPNKVNFELKFQDGFFLGIGEVKVNDILLRNGRRPMFVNITNPDGIEFLNYTLIDKEISDDEIILTFSMQETKTELMEWMLHTVRNRCNLNDWTEEPHLAENTELKLIIKPLTREIGAKTWTGFTYQYIYKSNHIPIYRMLDRATWEIGGNIVENEFWMRSGAVPSLVKFNNKTDFYSSEWYLPGIENPNIIQFHPLQTTLQGFTFTSSPEGTLVTWPNEVSHVNSLFEKERNKSEMAHIHEHCGDLAYEFSTSPVEVLYSGGALNHVQKANTYESVKELVYDALHAKAGLKRDRVTTYGVIEEWTLPDMDKYINKALPKLIEAGMKTVFLPNECQNAMNVYGVANMCCNVDFKIAEAVGEDNMREFCKKANDAGVDVEMWGNTAISTLVEMFSYEGQAPTDRLKRLPMGKGTIMEVVKKAKMPWIRNPSNAIESDHYTPRFCALNMRDADIYAYWMECWDKLYHDIGIRGIFLDSSFNMTSDKFHYVQNLDAARKGGATPDQPENLGFYRPEKEPEKAILSQYHAHISMVRDMQKTGYRYTGEDIGVFGVHRSGPGVEMRLNCMHIWTDCVANFNPHIIRERGLDPADIFFKGFAYRMIWMVHWDIKKEVLIAMGNTPFSDFSLFKAYNEVDPYLYNREILEDEKAVLYHKDNTYVLWAFENMNYKLPKSTVIKNILTSKSSRSKEIRAVKNNIYLYKVES